MSGHDATLLIVARHAPVAAAGLCYGQSDLDATVPDEEVADAFVSACAREELPYDHATTVWSSPLRRCAGPAARLAARLGARQAVDVRLSELSFGAWEGRRYDEVARDDPEALARFFDGWATGAAAPGGEGIVELERRVRAWIGELPSGVHLMVAHAGVVRAFRVVLRGATWAQAMSQVVEPLAIEAFRWRRTP